ncbi:MAG: flavodoxin domain-containing protein [Anaerovoracaceae bacterium]|nr:flavodoxin domain-containing protein [Anaerovoracaceae bacterium]
MEKTVVIFKTKYGATEKYARWIGEELECPVISADDFNKRDFEKYDNIVFGGGVHAGGITGFELIRKNMRRLAGKKLIIFAVGLNVMQAETRKQLRDINFSKRKVRGLTCYYCPGAYDPDRVHGADAVLMKMMKKMLKDKPDSDFTPEDRALLDAVENGTDLTDRRFIEPVVRAVRET